jgi:tetratricopeptide (TPR) repeat protein
MAATLFEFSQAVVKLNKEKKFDDALSYFKENKVAFTAEAIGQNVYLVSAMISALRHTKRFDNALKFLEIYKVAIDSSTKEIVLTGYGWLLYDKYKSENQISDSHMQEGEHDVIGDEEMFGEGTDLQVSTSATVELVKAYFPLILNYNSIYSYAVLSRLFNIVPKTEKKKGNANWRLINEICTLVAPEKLKTDCETIEVERKGKLVQMELASDSENWYAYKSKALMKLREFQDCYDVSLAALGTFEKFHYSNDVWFARRIALSKRQLGDSSSAIAELQAILRRKKEWFIQKELAELYQEAGDKSNAFSLAIEAINNFGDLEYKVDLLFLLGELLKDKGELDLSFQHFSLARLIRVISGWGIPAKLNSALDQFKREGLPEEKLEELKKDLRKYWNSFKQQTPIRKDDVGLTKVNGTTRLTGVVAKILHNDDKGADGFLTYDGSKSVYFRVNSDEAIKSKIKVGLEVDFKYFPAKEDKKERAVHLKERTEFRNKSSGVLTLV